MKIPNLLKIQLQKVLVIPLSFSLVLAGVPLPAASPAIGTVMANGSFRMNNMTVRGNATIFEGATLETAGSPSWVELANGAKLTLGADSKGQIFGDHMVLERGKGDMDRTLGLRMQARGLTIQPETGDATGRVQLAGTNKIQVEVSKGSFRVLNANGLLVAKLVPGVAMAFEPQASATLTRISGRLSLKAGHIVMMDETTHVTMEVVGKDGVVGKDLEKMAGKRVAITGALDPAAAPVSDASQLVRVSNVTLLAQAGAAPAGNASGTSGAAGSGSAGSASGGAAGGSAAGGSGAAAGAAGGAAAGGAAAGTTILGVGLTTVAIVGGVAAAAVVGGLAASGTIGGGSTPVSR